MNVSCQKIEKLQQEIDMLQRKLKLCESVSKQETRLKCQCFSFLVHKKLYDEWEKWRATEEAKRSIRFLLSKV